jgi:hypothetical protein
MRFRKNLPQSRASGQGMVRLRRLRLIRFCPRPRYHSGRTRLIPRTVGRQLPSVLAAKPPPTSLPGDLRGRRLVTKSRGRRPAGQRPRGLAPTGCDPRQGQGQPAPAPPTPGPTARPVIHDPLPPRAYPPPAELHVGRSARPRIITKSAPRALCRGRRVVPCRARRNFHLLKDQRRERGLTKQMAEHGSSPPYHRGGAPAAGPAGGAGGASRSTAGYTAQDTGPHRGL